MRPLILIALLATTGGSAGCQQRTNAMPANNNRTMHIELLALDLDTCGRCTGTGANLDDAISSVAAVLREADVEVEVRKTVVRTAAQAERLRFASSPTIRINGRDIAFELRETNCGDCGDLCGCEGQIDCRVWMWQGRQYDQAPKALIIDAVLRAYGTAWEPLSGSKTRFRLPANLRRFFDAQSQTTDSADHTANNECCDRTACCDADEKEACCGAGHSPGLCGCNT